MKKREGGRKEEGEITEEVFLIFTCFSSWNGRRR